MEAIEKKRCLRCGYEWYPYHQGRPVTCAKCRSPYWDKPRRGPKNDRLPCAMGVSRPSQDDKT